MQYVAFVPGLVAALVAWKRSPQVAFVSVYIPVLLLVPDYYRCVLPGLPDPTMNEAAIIPIAAIYLIRTRFTWRFTFTDLLVFGFAFCVGYSEYLNAGYNEAQNLMFDMVCSVILPYAMTKALVEPCGMRMRFARKLVFMLFVVSVTAIYEFKFGMTPFRLVLDRFFPGQGAGWVTTFRYGFARIAGPYGHAILAGVMLVVGYRLQRWLGWGRAWEPDFKWLPRLGFSKSSVITVGILAGVVMTMCRGPWIGGVLAAGVGMLGRAKNRKRALILVLGVLVFVGVPLFIGFMSYASVGRANAKTVAQESAAYRKELIDKYVAIAVERSVWGWGRNTWPKVEGMPSIDNYFLLLALMHGIVALAFLLAIFFVMMGRLFYRGMRSPPSRLPGSSLAFTLCGVFAAIFVSIATVYMGMQVMQLLFIITGWADGYLTSKGETSGIAEEVRVLRSPFLFRRVLT